MTVCVALVLMCPSIALAHADFQGSDPPPNALVQERPETVSLWFSEPVSPVGMRWISPEGESFSTFAEADGKQVRVSPPPEAGNGSYLLFWRVVSLDGHPVSGALVLSVGETSDVAALNNINWPPAATWSVVAAKLIVSICLIIGIGGTVYSVFIAKETRRTDLATTATLLLSVPAAALLVGCQGLDLLGLPLSALILLDPWVTGAETSIVRTALVSAFAALIALSVLRLGWLTQHQNIRVALTLVAWSLAAISYSLSGHTATAEPKWPVIIAMFIHSLSMLFWLGALLPLFGVLRQGSQALAELRRFSAFAMPLVGLLIISGFFMASIHTGSGGFQDLAMSGYGILLFVKLVSVIGLVLIAIHNRLVLTPAVNAGTTGAASALRGSIQIEIVLAVMIVVFASSFRLTPPPGFSAENQQPQIVEFVENDISVELRLNPGLAGPNKIELLLSDVADKPVKPIEVKFSFTKPGEEFGPIEVAAILTDEATWRTDTFILPQPGEWQVGIDLLITDFEIKKLTTQLIIDP